MLATPIENVTAPIEREFFVAENKIDGVRAQVHKRADRVWIFARGLDEVTRSFPEVESAFRFVPGAVALDGELCAMGEGGRPRPFMALQQRLGREAPAPSLVTSTPVAFIAFDLLADGDRDVLAEPWSDRRTRLEHFAAERGPRDAFVLSACAPFDGDLDGAFERARQLGYEGLVLKRTDSSYEAGRRGQSWIKVKRAFATLDVVVTAAEEGHGRRAGVLSDYTFGVWKDGEIVNVGKAYSGLTDEEIDALTRRFESITIERFGSVRAVRSEVVLEIAFDGIQRSKRHKSGFALRFPRIVRIREDKRPEEADTLASVERLFEAQLESGHREEETAADRPRAPKKRPKKPTTQLSLFGDPSLKKR
jgi:DNA ligase-1